MGNDTNIPLPVATARKDDVTHYRLARLFVGLILASLAIHAWCDKNLRVHPPCQLDDTRQGHIYGKEAEKLFLSVPNEASAIAASRQYATKPHVAGSPQDLETAKDFLTLLQTELSIKPPASLPIFPAGSPESQHATLSIPTLDEPRAWIDTYYPILNTPLERRLQVLGEGGEVVWEANLEEVSDQTDPEAGKYSNAVPAFHGLSPAGDVQGKLVSGGYCGQDDLNALNSKGASLEGTVVLCRYGGIFRGLKVKGVQEHGAVGVLIYSDPRDDGAVTVENGYTPYPHGPARNPSSVQRGSVQYLSMYPGDPTTPGYPSYENSTRKEAANIPRIPSLPISWENTQVLARVLEGGEWEGKTVRVLNQVDTKVTPVWNTLGVIPGHVRSEVIVVGNHRDAWVMGATDPSSGTVSLHEVVRGFGALLKKGWKPLRTILFVTWDAEEYGLVGSTEWGEDFSEWIGEHVVAYLNLDSSVSGSQFKASASPLLSHFVRGTAEEIQHPTDKNRTLWDATQDDGAFFGLRADGKVVVDREATAAREAGAAVTDNLGVAPLGSGSDYTVFLQHLGVPSTNGGFGATLHDAAYHYHSVFDSHRWQEVYGDPGFFRHVAVAKHLGLQILRLSNLIVLPFNTTHYARELEVYLDQVEEIASVQTPQLDLTSLRKSIHSLQKTSLRLESEKVKAEQELRKVIKKWNKRHSMLGELEAKLRAILHWIKSVFGVHSRHPGNGKAVEIQLPVWIHGKQGGHAEGDSVYRVATQAGFVGEAFDLEPQYHNDSEHYHSRKLLERLRHAVKRVQRVNRKLATFERGFISEEGIKDREWYKHLAVAPGKWLGYGATTLPGLTEALTLEKNTTLAIHEAGRIKNLVDKLVQHIRV